MHVIVDGPEGRLVEVDVAQLGADGLPIEEGAVPLLDSKHAGFEAAPDRPEIRAHAVE